jgi:uncharacterized RDD family membrane protein YckC
LGETNLHGGNGEQLKSEGGKRHALRDVATMALNFFKIALLAGLTILTVGVFPDRRRGAIIAIGTCIAATVVLHFVAP